MAGSSLVLPLAALWWLTAGPALADEPTSYDLRLATVAPQGTAWAREAMNFARTVEAETQGLVHVKWYFGGIAGDAEEMAQRVQRGQLDGAATALLCDRMAPSLRVLELAGFYRDREEWSFVLNKLRPEIDRELAHAGFVNLGEGGLGPAMILSREPVRSMRDLRRTRLWVWRADDQARRLLTAMGVPELALPLDAASHAYDEKLVDGFFAVPTAALAFQWSARARYFSPLVSHYLSVCLVMTNRAFDRLPLAHQQTVRAAAAKMVSHFDSVGREQDAMLVGGLFQRQGLRLVPPQDGFKREYNEAAREASIHDPAIALALVERVSALLEGYRAAHTDAGKRR